MVSDRKHQANGRNAKRSTGPKDTRRTKYNAQKHGMLSQATIIQIGDLKEDPHELESLSDELWEDLAPVGKMEQILVDSIVSFVWRKRRALRAEVGGILRVTDSTVKDGTQSTADHQTYTGKGLTIDMRPGRDPTPKALRGWSASTEIAHIKEVLDLTRSLVEEQGHLTKDQLAEVTKSYDERESSMADTLAAFASMATGGSQTNDREKSDTGRDSPAPKKCKKALLSLIDREIAKLDDEADLLSERKELEREVAVLSRYLPSDEVLGGTLRYETTMDRQMYRALKELRELQAARRARATRLGVADNGV